MFVRVFVKEQIRASLLVVTVREVLVGQEYRTPRTSHELANSAKARTSVSYAFNSPKGAVELLSNLVQLLVFCR